MVLFVLFFGFVFFFPGRILLCRGLFVRVVPPSLLPSMAGDAAVWDPSEWLCSVLSRASPAAVNRDRHFPRADGQIIFPWVREGSLV